jgi:hypothetical protein
LHAAADRIEHYIESEGQDGRLQLHATRKSWAAELGLTHEALYRALARLRRAGRIGVIEKAGVLVLSMTRAQQASHPRTRASPETGGLQ